MRRQNVSAAVAAAVGALVLVPAGSAPAAATCSFDAGTGTLNVVVGPSGDVLRRSGTALTLDGSPCGAATVTSTDRIQVGGEGTVADLLVADLAGGPFADPGTSAEIPMAVAATVDLVRVDGTGGADRFRAGGAGLDLTGDGDVDATLA